MVWRKLGKGTGPRVVHHCCDGRREVANNFMNDLLEYNFNIITAYIYIRTNKYRDSSENSILILSLHVYVPTTYIVTFLARLPF